MGDIYEHLSVGERALIQVMLENGCGVRTPMAEGDHCQTAQNRADALAQCARAVCKLVAGDGQQLRRHPQDAGTGLFGGL